MQKFFRSVVAHPIFLLSLLLALVGWFVTDIFLRDAKTAAIIGLQLAVLGFLLEVLYQNFSAKQEILNSLGLWKSASRSTLRPTLERILAACRDENVETIPIPRLRQRVIESIEEVSRHIERLAEGQIHFDSANWFAVDSELVQSATKEILATSHADATAIWGSTLGGNYWIINKERIAKGVKCTRIFILSKSELQDANKMTKVLAVMDEQSTSGVRVYVVEETQINRDLCKDFAIVDSLICSRTILTHGGEGAGVEICWRASDVMNARREFNLILSNSMPLADYMKAYNIPRS